jgi:bifunctional non-homologous end joining protein LigD
MMAADRLERYRSKRDFERTPEPPPRAVEAAATGRFVVQEHHARRLHWDLRLEHEGTLASWALPRGFPETPGEDLPAARTEDHPLGYIDFEGEIPAGSYGAGSVTVWDQGSYRADSFEDGKVVVELQGQRLHGRYALYRMRDDDWRIHRMDPPDPGRAVMPDRIVPMLAQIGSLPADEARYGFEVKWDGIRALLYWRPGRLRIETRNLAEVSARWPELRGIGEELAARSAVLDGEIVAFDDEGRPSFERLQSRMHVTGEAAIRRRAAEIRATYVIFDLLWLEGEGLMDRPYTERRERLEALALHGAAWQTPGYHRGEGARLLEATREQGLEGVVAKRLDSRYEPGRRSGAWVKIKNRSRQEFVIGGWLRGEMGRASRLGAILVGYRDDEGRLRYAGKVGMGFSDADRAALRARLCELEREDSPFVGRQPVKNAIFAEPVLLAEIEFDGWTSSHMLRHPSYKGLRDDLDAGNVVRERAGEDDVEVEVEGRRLRLTNLRKVLYPESGTTKARVLEYYARIAPTLLPYLHGRPMTLKRYPDGVAGPHFYDKHCAGRPPWVETLPMWSERKGEDISFCRLDDTASLLWSVNFGNLEMHPLLSVAPDFDTPTAAVFDLDPGEPAGILDAAEIALLLREMLRGVGLESFAKSTGSKGVQVYVPLNTPVTFDATKAFARSVAEVMADRLADRVTARVDKRLRAGKVFVDWGQNDRHKSTVAAYSLRAKRERPTVSLPFEWDELRAAAESGEPDALLASPQAALDRVDARGDTFAPVLSLIQALPGSAAGLSGRR